MQELKTQFIYDHNGKAIGRVDENGTIYTLEGKISYPWVNTKAGPYPSAAHIRRERAARNQAVERDGQLDAETSE